MKKKQFMSKLAALTMAAMMGLSAVPAGTINVMAAVVSDEGSKATLDDTHDDGKHDVSNAKDALTGTKSIAGATDKDSAKTVLKNAITASINGVSSKAVIDVTSFTAATNGDPGTSGKLEGTATWNVSGKRDPLTDNATWNDVTLTVNFTATWTYGEDTATFTAGTANGTVTTYTASSDSKVNNADYVTVSKRDAESDSNKEKQSTAAKIKKALVPAGGTYLDGSTYWNDDTNKWVGNNINASTVKNDIETRYLTAANSLGDYKVDADSVKFTNSKKFSFNVYNQNDSAEVYTVDITVDATTLADPVKNALDNFFNVHTYKISKGQTLTNGAIADELNTELGKASSDEIDNATMSGYTVYGNTTALTVKDGEAAGDLTIKSTGSGNSYSYHFTAKVDESDKTLSETEAAAIAKINATTYPSYNDGTTNHDLTALINKIDSDLKDAGYKKGIDRTTFNNDSDYDIASSTKDGFLKGAIGSTNSISVKLGYSSDQKSADTNKSLVKALKGSLKTAAVDTPKTIVTEHATGEVTGKPDGAVTLNAGKYTAVDIAANSSLSTAIQSTTATKEATKAEVVAGVQKAIEDQLTKDGVKDNGVTVTVKAVNTYNDNNVTDGHTSTKPGDAVGGSWTLLVTTSIANDFYGYSTNGTDKDESQKTEVNYLVTLHTSKLKKSDATGISLADKTVNLAANYATSPSLKENACTYTYVEIKPTLTPADANSNVTYKVVDSDGNVIASNVSAKSIVDATDGKKVMTDPLFKHDSADKVSVSDYALGLAVTKAGTYKVTATTSTGYSATATVTVNENFKDVPSTAYFSEPVKWAYKNEITAGVNETTFGSYVDVTRGQFVTWLYKYAVSKDSSVEIADSDVKSVFSDVATDKFYAKAVQWAVANNVTAGTTATTFSPDQKITRAQALTMLWRAMGSPNVGIGKEDEATLKFTDLPTNQAFRTAMVWAIHEEVTDGTTPTTCSPDNICPRSQAITFIYGANNWFVNQ